jgi:hypothetical protein
MLFEADSQLLTRFSNLDSRLSTLDAQNAGMHDDVSVPPQNIANLEGQNSDPHCPHPPRPQPQLSLIRTPSSVAYRKTRTGIILHWSLEVQFIPFAADL